MIRRGARDAPGMNQHTIAEFQVGGVLLKLKRERFSFRNNLCSADCPEIVHAKLQPAVIQQIGEILVCIPPLAFNEPRELSEILQLGSLRGGRPVTE